VGCLAEQARVQKLDSVCVRNCGREGEGWIFTWISANVELVLVLSWCVMTPRIPASSETILRIALGDHHLRIVAGVESPTASSERHYPQPQMARS
jgi:hypothetical protein